MYGPPPPAAPPDRPGAKALTVRWLFASFPVWSLCLLAWVPPLRIALIRKRNRDWAYFGLYVMLTFGLLLLVWYVPTDPGGGEGAEQGSDDADPYSAMVGFLFLSYMVGAVIHAVRADRFPRAVPAQPSPPAGLLTVPLTVPPAAPPVVPPAPPAGTPFAPGPAAPGFGPPAAPAPAVPTAPDYPRMRQVASELDELGEYLRRQEGR
ncbi:hypothetical protein [Streptomyces sp. B6B3]|uniref:hypothetical protein n=1 Tax=Streptomyces sp. B6B3 TaxID=3153570 RepID=UPI00325D736A